MNGPIMAKDQNKDSRQLVIEVLGNKWPLSAREIYRKMVSENGKSITYQAVHKIIVNLLKENIVEKEGSGYKLNMEWIGKLKSFGENLMQKYSGKNMDVSTLAEGTSYTAEFNSPMAEVYYWALAQHALILQRFGPLEKASFQYPMWPITIISDQQYKQMEYMLIPENGKANLIHGKLTPVDKFLLRVWESFGVISAVSKETWALNPDHSTSIVGDIVFNYYHEPAAKKEWVKVYDGIGEEVEMKPVYELFFEKTYKSQIIVTRNKMLAEKYLEEARRIIDGSQIKKTK